ncbi:unnamed protein product, partial [marine sediment metagenome]
MRLDLIVGSSRDIDLALMLNTKLIKSPLRCSGVH